MFLPRHSAKQPFFYFLENIFVECNYLGTRRSLKLRRVPDDWHSAKIQTSPSARSLTLGKNPNFAECGQVGTRRSLNLCRVPSIWHSAKFSTRPVRPSRSPVRRPVRQFTCPSVRPVSTFFSECDLAHGKGLPSAREKTLGKAGFAGRRKTVCASPSAILGKEVAECFSAFAECL